MVCLRTAPPQALLAHRSQPRLGVSSTLPLQLPPLARMEVRARASASREPPGSSSNAADSSEIAAGSSAIAEGSSSNAAGSSASAPSVSHSPGASRDEASASGAAWAVLTFAPNLVDYVRIALTAFAFGVLPESQAGPFVALYLLNFALDGIDGMLARRLRQSSTLGAFLDVCIDNTTRQLMWARALGGHWLGAIVPAVEWLVFACTHSQTLRAESRGSEGPGTDRMGVEGHRKPRDWREGFQRAPWWVARVMSNGFKNPAGALAIGGIHFFPLWLWLSNGQQHHNFPWLSSLQVGGLLALGRLIGMAVETWVIQTHFLSLLSDDVDRYLSKKQE